MSGKKRVSNDRYTFAEHIRSCSNSLFTIGEKLLETRHTVVPRSEMELLTLSGAVTMADWQTHVMSAEAQGCDVHRVRTERAASPVYYGILCPSHWFSAVHSRCPSDAHGLWPLR